MTLKTSMLNPLCNEQGCVIIPVFRTCYSKSLLYPYQSNSSISYSSLNHHSSSDKNPSYKVNEIGGKIIEILIKNIAIRIIIHFKISQHITIKN